MDRVHAGELGLTQKDVVDNVITALNSNLMIAPNYWVDRKTGNDYFLTVQYFEHGSSAIHNFTDLKNIPLRAPNLSEPTTLGSVVKLEQVQTPTEVDHYQIQRIADVYVTPAGEDLGKVTDAIRGILTKTTLPGNVRVNLRGMVQGMTASFQSFAMGLSLSVLLLYLILVAQFRSFKDPLLIMLAIPMGFIGVLIILPLTAYHAQCHVADGRPDAGRHCGVQQYSDRGVCPSPGRARQVRRRRGDNLLPGALATHPDDVAGDHHRHGADGIQNGYRKRAVCALGARHYRRPIGLGGADGFHCSGSVRIGLRKSAA